MKRFNLAIIATAVPLLLLPGAATAVTPIQFAAPNLRAPDDASVDGVRLSLIHGENRSVRGVDLGVVSLSETSKLSGFSAVLGVGRVNGDMDGCAVSLVNVHSGTDDGLNAAFVNRINNLDHGANVGFVNVADGYTRVDLGGMNVSDASSVQLGLLNLTGRITGVQIGFLNVAENGFLPVFPFFNFPKKGTD
jgi:hypothetical protein